MDGFSQGLLIQWLSSVFHHLLPKLSKDIQHLRWVVSPWVVHLVLPQGLPALGFSLRNDNFK
uniref:Uncharacterized protein n=1 Tax=Rhizophora mucronata TaxID=61149 RepID=A0A2P2P4S0_RHIMU